MSRTDGTYRPGVSIHEAAVMMGVSPSTVRRWVASGKLRSQRFDRPQGEVVRVFVGAEQRDAPTVVREQVSEAQVPTDAPPRADVQVSADDQAAAIAALIQTTIRETLTPIIAPLLAANERQAETIREQAATIGALTERLAAATAPKSSPDGPGSTETDGTAQEPPTRFSALWSRWWLALAALSVCSVVLVAALLAWWR